MVGIGDGAMVSEAIDAPRTAHASSHVNWALAFLMLTILIAAVAGVTVALFSGMPTIALVIALITGAIFAGVAC
ncbi:hypothetical protein [Mycolicibacterium iranicum]|uniref:Uncharacterized protein n=1 Tax=Mycolicibacterium iranicum TaxID=912594 RepID=A0A1X1WVR9_MYCIR|nr:hypothetical protein [Mycolicibacterium iranicum]MCZ0730064.1 hypothetical protein [Mycolicibacterium iranicum]ORV90578.1 hypothetical protein AWC12_07525 [Mycolicibacterium iranicum]